MIGCNSAPSTKSTLLMQITGRIPDDWFASPVVVRSDRDEILVHGELPLPAATPEGESLPDGVLEQLKGYRDEAQFLQ